MSTRQFKLPDVGEGLTEAEIVQWHVAVGDVIKVNDPIVDIETAKSIVELPSPYAGTVRTLLADAGSTVPVGSPIFEIDSPGSDDPPGADQPSGSDQPAAAATTRTPSAGGANGDGHPGALLVGSGPKSGERRLTVPLARPPSPVTLRPQVSTPPALVPSVPATPNHVAAAPAPNGLPRAKPPVRKLARELGIDLDQVTPTGPTGVITREDLAQFGSAAPEVRATTTSVIAAAGPRESRTPIRGVRRATAAAMVQSAFTAPHATEFVELDFTRSLKAIESLRSRREFVDVRLTLLAWLGRCMCLAARRTPEVTARWDEANGEIVWRNYVNLGIAAATDRGLLVPNVKDADQLDLIGLANAIDATIASARAGKATPHDLTGGTLTITNVGPFGIDTGTPILPVGESAIVCIGSVTKRPWVVKDKIKIRRVGTLSLSFDHRLIDGEGGSRFLADVARLIEHPEQTLAFI